MDKDLELLDKFYSGQSNDVEKRRLSRRLADTDRWEDDFDEIWRHSFGTMPDEADERVFRRLRRAAQSRPAVRWRSALRTVLQVAACVLWVTGMGALYWLWQENRTLTRYEQVVVRTQPGQKSEVSLPDGTVVHLNAASRLSYGRSRFTGRERRVELEGEAYFEVAKDRRSPFTVRSGAVEVRALGTAFNVKAYPDDPTVTAYLAEGSVEVTASHRSVRLSPGESVEYTSGDGRLTRQPVGEARLHVGWMNDEMVFEDEPLAKVVDTLGRYYNVRFELKSRRLHTLTFSGTLRNASLQSVLYALQFTAPVSCRLNGGVIELHYHE